MDFVTILGKIIDLAVKIKTMSDSAKANSERCKLLANRVQIIGDLIQRLKQGNKDLTGLQTAARARDKKAIELLGLEKAKKMLNFPV
jgi:flagellar biosynthesis/type III secretory pathway chaperone